MSEKKEAIARIIAALTGEQAPTLFDRGEVSLRKWLKGAQGKKSIALVQGIIEKELEAFDAIKFLDELNDYAFLLPKKHRDSALQSFNETGEIELIIKRDANGPKVGIKRIGNAIPQNVPEGVFPIVDERHVQEPVKTPVALQAPVALPSVVPTRTGGVAICLATNRDIDASAHKSIISQFRMADLNFGHENVRYLQVKNTAIMMARNLLAQEFLASGLEWSFWMDDDMVSPTGNGAWYRGIAESDGTKCGYDPAMLAQAAVLKLTQGPHKLVSGCYPTREHTRRLVAQSGMNPAGYSDKEFCEMLKQGPKPGYMATGWVGFGCVAVHRDVFLAIQKACPELAPANDKEPWKFFTGDYGTSEDVAFCLHARKAGFTPMLDTSVFALHIGKFAYRI